MYIVSGLWSAWILRDYYLFAHNQFILLFSFNLLIVIHSGRGNWERLAGWIFPTKPQSITIWSQTLWRRLIRPGPLWYRETLTLSVSIFLPFHMYSMVWVGRSRKLCVYSPGGRRIDGGALWRRGGAVEGGWHPSGLLLRGDRAGLGQNDSLCGEGLSGMLTSTHTHIHDSMYLGDESSSCNADQRSEKVFLWTGERVRKLNGKHASLSFSMHTLGVLHPWPKPHRRRGAGVEELFCGRWTEFHRHINGCVQFVLAQ